MRAATYQVSCSGTIMTPARTAAYIGGGLLLLAWLSSAAGVMRPPRPPRTASVTPTALGDALAFDVQAQADRLQKRLAAAPVPHQPARNPFIFPARSTPSPRTAPQIVAPSSPVVVADSEPQLTLVGVAEQQTPQGLVRTALIAGSGDDLYMVVEGQPVAWRYRVVAVSADAVELKDVTNDRIRRLGLK